MSGRKLLDPTTNTYFFKRQYLRISLPYSVAYVYSWFVILCTTISTPFTQRQCFRLNILFKDNAVGYNKFDFLPFIFAK